MKSIDVAVREYAVHMVGRDSYENTKINKDYFQKLTGYNSNTSEHGRDTAMLVFWA